VVGADTADRPRAASLDAPCPPPDALRPPRRTPTPARRDGGADADVAASSWCSWWVGVLCSGVRARSVGRRRTAWPSTRRRSPPAPAWRSPRRRGPPHHGLPRRRARWPRPGGRRLDVVGGGGRRGHGHPAGRTGRHATAPGRRLPGGGVAHHRLQRRPSHPADLSGGELSLQGAHDDVAARDVCANLSGASALIGIYFDSGASPSDGGASPLRRGPPVQRGQPAPGDARAEGHAGRHGRRGWQIPDDGVQPDSVEDRSSRRARPVPSPWPRRTTARPAARSGRPRLLHHAVVDARRTHRAVVRDRPVRGTLAAGPRPSRSSPEASPGPWSSISGPGRRGPGRRGEADAGGGGGAPSVGREGAGRRQRVGHQPGEVGGVRHVQLVEPPERAPQPDPRRAATATWARSVGRSSPAAS